MSKIVENEDGFPCKDFRKWEMIKFGEGKNTSDYNKIIRDTLKFRKTLFHLWIITEDYNTKGEVEKAIEELNKRLINDLDIFI